MGRKGKYHDGIVERHLAQGEVGIAACQSAPDEDHGGTWRGSEQDEPSHVGIQLLRWQPLGKKPADKDPGQQRHGERFDRPVDKEGDADALPMGFHLVQGTEVDFHQHWDDHDPDEQPHRDIDLGDLQLPQELKGSRNPLSEPDTDQDAERNPKG
ncbi:MAG: hypothetical protein N838_15490 [Thiohalocapsa sp. PB-PSB1]|nr:MAG: hypothetical protein N838_15490 [Thiohalocapsa sp. PB-PSB1]